MTYIVKLLPKCSSSHPEMVTGMYLIIAQLTVKAQLSQDLINNIFKFMIQVKDEYDRTGSLQRMLSIFLSVLKSNVL